MNFGKVFDANASERETSRQKNNLTEMNTRSIRSGASVASDRRGKKAKNMDINLSNRAVFLFLILNLFFFRKKFKNLSSCNRRDEIQKIRKQKSLEGRERKKSKETVMEILY